MHTCISTMAEESPLNQLHLPLSKAFVAYFLLYILFVCQGISLQVPSRKFHQKHSVQLIKYLLNFSRMSMVSPAYFHATLFP